MLVVDAGDRWRLITQPDHAHLSGRLAALWRTDGLPEHPRRTDVIFAAREHDNGWREADAAPRWNAHDRRPHDFMSLPAEDRCEIWRRGVSRYAAERPYAARLIGLHALTLHEDRRDEPAYEALLDSLEEREEELAEVTDVAAEEARRDYEWIAATDRMSLAVLLGWSEPRTLSLRDRAIRMTSAGEGTLLLDPSPLAGATTFQVLVRHVEKRDYGGDSHLAVALATARFEPWKVRLSGAGERS